MTVIVDSSVWIAHFKRRNDHLVELLEADEVYCHPYVIGELACGTPPPDGHFKFPHFWPPKFPHLSAGLEHCQAEAGRRARRAAASLSR